MPFLLPVLVAPAQAPAAPRPAPEVLVRKFWDAFNRAAWSELDALVAPGYRHHPGDKSLTLEEFKQGGAWVHQGLRPYALHIDRLIVQGDRVAIAWTAKGTHVGSFFGEKPTGREVRVQGMHIFRIEAGLLAEDWEVIDMDGFRKQLGAR